jgi:ABC-2 type transport system permease protein
MKNALQIIKAEIVKQHRNTFHSKMTYFSLLIWPIMLFFNAYYSYKVFNLNQSIWKNFNSSQSVITFLITGFLGYNCFWSLVQSAWQMGFERQDGTLEVIFLSSVNRIVMIYGRVLGALFENIWMFLLFSTFIIIYLKGIPITRLIYLPIAFIILLSSAMVWGGLMNVLFLFSRDASILFNIFDEPMALFSGVKVPTMIFPLWAKCLSIIFPLTHTLVIIRSLLIEGKLFYNNQAFYILLLINFLLVALTLFLLKKAEKHARITGSLSFY